MHTCMRALGCCNLTKLLVHNRMLHDCIFLLRHRHLHLVAKRWLQWIPVLPRMMLLKLSPRYVTWLVQCYLPRMVSTNNACCAREQVTV